MPNLSQRDFTPEVMDQPGLSADEHAEALKGLRRINSASRTARALWHPMAQLAKRLGTSSLSVLDVACGGGDVAVALCQRARRHGLTLSITGCDVSPFALEYARRQALAANCDIELVACNVLSDPLPAGCDIVISSLFLHHVAEDAATGLLQRMAAAASHMLLVSDLRRSVVGYWLAVATCRLLSSSKVVHVDGPRSVANALTIAEARQLCAAAGLDGALVRRQWPCRWLLTWERNRTWRETP